MVNDVLAMLAYAGLETCFYLSGSSALWLLWLFIPREDFHRSGQKSYLARIRLRWRCLSLLVSLFSSILPSPRFDSPGKCSALELTHYRSPPFPCPLSPSSRSFGGSRGLGTLSSGQLLLDRTVLAACLCSFFCTMVLLTGLFYIPLYLQVRGHTATDAGLLLLPSPVGGSLASVGAGIIMNRTGKYAGLGVASLGRNNVWCHRLWVPGQKHPYWLIATGVFLVGSSCRSMLTTTLLACMAAVEHSHQAVIAFCLPVGFLISFSYLPPRRCFPFCNCF